MGINQIIYVALALMCVAVCWTDSYPLSERLRKQQSSRKAAVAQDVETTTQPMTTTDIETTIESDFLADVSDNVTHYQYAYKWLSHYGYISEEEELMSACIDCPVDQCSDNCVDVLQAAITSPLVAYKTAYGFKQVDGLLTNHALARMRERRCLKPDIEKQSPDSPRRVKRYTSLTDFNWDLNRTPVIVISFKRYLPQFTAEQQQRIALECASMWAAPTALTFDLKDFGPSTNIAIDFMSVDGPWNSLGTGQSPNYNPPGYSYMNLDKDEPWKLNTGSKRGGVSLKWAICHEMGHNLNLGHSPRKEALMYPTGMGQNENRLSNDDLNGIVDLYGRSNGQTLMDNAAAILSRSQGGQPRPQAAPKSGRRFTTRQPNTQGRRRTTTRRPNRRGNRRSGRRNRSGSRRQNRRPQRLVATRQPAGLEMAGVVAGRPEVGVKPTQSAQQKPSFFNREPFVPLPGSGGQFRFAPPFSPDQLTRSFPRTTLTPYRSSPHHLLRSTSFTRPTHSSHTRKPPPPKPVRHTALPNHVRRTAPPNHIRRTAPPSHVQRTAPPNHVYNPRPGT